MAFVKSPSPSCTRNATKTRDVSGYKSDILFASNNIELAVDVTIGTGTNSLPGSLSLGSVILCIEPEDEISLAVGVKDAMSMSTVSFFGMTTGLEVKLYPEQGTIIAPNVLSPGIPFNVKYDLRLHFKSQASFWAFAFYTSGTGYSFGFNFPKCRSDAPFTMNMLDCGDFLQRRAVVEFPGDKAASSWDL